MNSMLKSKAAALWCLAYFLVCGVVPVALLVSEYPPEHASTYMKVYGHFFLYPLFFGWIPVFLAVCAYPRIHTILAGKTTALWITMILVTLLAFGIELSSDNVAPWEIRAERLSTLKLDDHFTRRLRPAPDTPASSAVQERAALERYQALTVQEIRHPSSWSPVRYAYPFSFFGQILALLLVLVSSLALMVYRTRSRDDDSVPRWHKDSLSVVSLAAAICVLYTLCRLAFSNDKKIFFATVSNEINSWVVVLLFALALVCLAACWSLWIGKHIETILPVGAFTGFVALVGLQPDKVMNQFGRNADFAGYMTVLLGVALCVILWVLFALPPDETA